MVHAGKCRTVDELKLQTIKKLNNPEKANNAKQNYLDLVAFYNTWPGNEVGLFYMLPNPQGEYKEETRPVKGF